MTAIFISHRSVDNSEAQALKEWLGEQGHERLFLDFDPADGIPAGVDWEQRLYQELRRCQALLIVLTPAWLESKWCGNELAIAREKGKAVFVVRVKTCPDGPLIPAIQEVDLTLDRAVGLEKLARGLGEHGLDPRDAFDWKPDRPIYPGLAAFDVDDAAVYFGRSDESWQTIEALRHLRLQARGSPKLLLITGASGSGKSSLMRAGVLARLRKEPASWIAARPFRRGADAMAALAEALAWAFPPDRRPTSLEAITARLAGPDGAGQLIALARELRFALDRADATLVLALDQAEELLASERGDDAARLLDLFRETLAVAGNEILVIATIRSDRLAAWQQHASIKATADHDALPFEMMPLGPMPMERVGEIVRGPASYEGLQIDDDLVDAIRAHTASPDALPLLAYTLQYLHRHFAGDGRLTLVQYQSFGGLEGSVRSQADAAIPIEKMSEEDRQALRDAFVPGLVRATAQGGFSRNRALLATLPPRAEPYLRRLIDEARLLTTGADPQGGVTVEVAHESLLRVWPTLVRWIAEDAEGLRRLEAIQRAAHDWTKAGRGEDFLIHRGGRLEEAEALVSEARFALTDPVERDYLDACLARRRREEEEAQAVREREAKAERDRLELEAKAAAEREAAARKIVQRTRIGAGVALCLAAAAAVVGYIAYENAQRAEAALASAQISDSQRFAAFSKEATRQDQAELGVQMALDALDQADTPEARDALREAVFQLHDVVTLNQEGVTFADFGPDPDGRYVLTASEDGVAHIWDLVSGKDPVSLWGHGGSIWAAQFSGDGARVMTASEDGTARLWDAATGKNLLTRPERAEPILAAQLSGDGSRMVIVSENDGSAHVWDTQTGEEIVTLSVPEGPIGVAAFSPGGERLVTGSEGGTASVWDLATGHEIALLKGHTGPITAVEFAPDGARVVSASFDGTARVWQAQSGEPVADLTHDSYVKTAHFSPDGQRVITATWGGIVRLWDVASGEVHEVRGINDAHFGPGGRLAIGADDGTASVWDAATGQSLAALDGDGSAILTARFSADGQRVVTAGGTAKLWWLRTFDSFQELLDFARGLDLPSLTAEERGQPSS